MHNDKIVRRCNEIISATAARRKMDAISAKKTDDSFGQSRLGLLRARRETIGPKEETMLDVDRARLVALSFTLAAVLTAPLAAQPAGYNELAPAQAAANAQPGARKSPAHTSPVPTDEVSAEAQKLIGSPYPPHFNADPKTAQEWKDLINARAKLATNAVPAMKEKFGVTVEPTNIGGVQELHRHAGHDARR